jgi:diguanylate cyclase (GGDEF)-like protein
MAAEAQRLLELVRAVPAACLLLDGAVVLAANAEAVEVIAVPSIRLVGAALEDLVLPEHRRRVQQLVAEPEADLGRAEVRLAWGLRPVELSARRLSGRYTLVAVRSMAREIELSAAAGGVLTHDPVTGLPNRHFVLEELHHRLHGPLARPLACLAIWIDDLAQVVEERGAKAADRILCQVGERIHNRLRAPDVLGRLDEHGFLALMASDMDGAQLGRVALRLREEIAFPVEHENALLSFTASMAVAPVGRRRPSLERLLGRLEAVGRRATSQGGGLLETVDP